MSRPRVVLVAGTRPELIKLAPVLRALRQRGEVEALLVATAQHRELLDQACAAAGIVPDLDLDLMRPDQDLAELTARVTAGVDRALASLGPAAVLVHGDTTTCLAAALASFYRRIPVGHVEAGLRTYDFLAPWPEEMNRRLTDPLCQWCFAPTERAAENLLAERIPREKVFVVGNTAVDALLFTLARVRAKPPEIPGLDRDVLDRHRIVLVTAHRRESFGPPLAELCAALDELVTRHPDVAVVYPVHVNPRVLEPVTRRLGGRPRVHLVQPLEHPAFVSLLDRCTLVLTDSGGVLEEAPTLHKPVLVTRRVTERPEAVEHGMARIVGTARDTILEEASRLLDDAGAYAEMTRGANPYGDGQTAPRIAEILVRALA
jgi:UDP-N-acetylglucosamine 2-epimerase (non-hydrolysing)